MKIFKSEKNTFLLLFAILVVFISFFTFFLFTYSNSFYNNNTDDIIQYFTIMEEFTIKLKNGNLSLYSFGDYLGSSFFADLYYIPMDIFSLITFILSFFVRFEFAFGFTEMLKLLSGTMLFSYYLMKRGYKPKTFFFVSLIYAIMGGNVALMAFPTYYSMIFYIPVVLIFIELFFEDKKYLLPILPLCLIFYDYYIAYTLLLFQAIIFVLRLVEIYGIKEIKKIGILFGKYLGLTFLGVLMGFSILLPSALYIVNDTFRTIYPYSLWSYKNGEYFDQYFRFIAEVFTPQFPTGYYGFQNHYIKEHFSLYITITGFLLILDVYHLKDDLSKIYKIVLPIEIILIIIPLFSMIFSGNSSPYTRWFILLDVINLLILTHVLEATDFHLDKSIPNKIIKCTSIILILGITLNYYFKRMFSKSIFEAIYMELTGGVFVPNKTFWSFNYLRIDLIMMLVAVGIVLAVTILSFIRRFNIIPIALSIEIIIGACFMCYIPLYSGKNATDKIIKRDNINNYLDEMVPYDNSLNRIYVSNEVDLFERRNFTRTNSQFTNLSIFHSFYDANANSLTTLLFNKEEGAGKTLLDDYSSIYLNTILGRKYLLLNHNTEYMLPSYFKHLEDKDDGTYSLYEVLGANPFIVYDYQAKNNYYNETNSLLFRQAYLLNSFYYDEDDRILDPLYKSDFNYLTARRFYKNSDEHPFLDVTSFDNKEYLVYDMSYNDISFLDDELIPEEGIIHFYYPKKKTLLYESNVDIETKTIYLGYEKNGEYFKTGRCLERFCYYDKKSLKQNIEGKMLVFVENTKKMTEQDESDLILCAEYGSHSPYERYLESESKYSNRRLSINQNEITLSFERKSLNKLVVSIPVTYNKNWVSNYKVIKINGGMLGVIVDNEDLNPKITLKFKAQGYKEGSIISSISLGIYGSGLLIYFKKKEYFNL